MHAVETHSLRKSAQQAAREQATKFPRPSCAHSASASGPQKGLKLRNGPMNALRALAVAFLLKPPPAKTLLTTMHCATPQRSVFWVLAKVEAAVLSKEADVLAQSI